MNIKSKVAKKFGAGVAVLPLKFSEAAFDGISEHEMSIEQRMS